MGLIFLACCAVAARGDKKLVPFSLCLFYTRLTILYNDICFLKTRLKTDTAYD